MSTFAKTDIELLDKVSITLLASVGVIMASTYIILNSGYVEYWEFGTWHNLWIFVLSISGCFLFINYRFGTINRRRNFIQTRLFIVAFWTSGVALNSYFNLYSPLTCGEVIAGYLGGLALSYFLGLPYYLGQNKVRPRPNLRLRWMVPVALIFSTAATAVVILNGNYFIENKPVVWSQVGLTADDFRGYSHLFTDYDAGISSKVKIRFDSGSTDRVVVSAICNTRYSWINPDSRDSESLLRHEQYHFNITEAHARMARKILKQTPKSEIDGKFLIDLEAKIRNQKDKMQDAYDLESDHSIITDRQREWEYTVDSILNEHLYYATPTVYLQSSDQYFRRVRIDTKHKIVGLYPINAGDTTNTAYYHIQRNDLGKVERVRYFSYGSKAIDSYFDCATVEVSHAANSQTWKFLDAEGKPIANDLGSYGYRITEERGERRRDFLDRNYEIATNSRGYASRIYILDSLARMATTKYRDLAGRFVKDTYGDYQIVHRLNADGFTLSNLGLDAAGNPKADVYGVAEYRFQYDEFGNRTRADQFDVNGRLVEDEEGVAFTIRDYDEWGNKSYEANYDALGNISAKGLVAAKTWAYNRNRNIVRVSHLDLDSLITVDKDGVASKYSRYDDYGRVVEESQYGASKNLVFDDYGFGITRYKRDSVGRIIERTNWNSYGRYNYNGDGAYIEKFSYTGSSRDVNEVRYLNTEDSLINGAFGDAIARYKYDSAGNLIEASYYDSLDRLTPVEEDVAVFRYEYDERNNKTKASFYDSTDQLANANQGVAINTYIYNKKGQSISRSYFDKFNRLKSFDGYGRIDWKYDERSNETEVRYYDEDNELMDTGMAIKKMQYDRHDNLIYLAKYNSRMELVEGAAINRWSYNEKGKILEKSYYNRFGEPTNEDGIFKQKYTYDSTGNNVVSVAYYNERNELTSGPQGIALIKYNYDKYGNTTLIENYHEGLSLTNDTLGIAREEYDYHRLGALSEKRLYQFTGNLIEGAAIYKWKRDKAGRWTEQTSFDMNGDFANGEEGYALRKRLYDLNGNAIELEDLTKEELDGKQPITN